MGTNFEVTGLEEFNDKLNNIAKQVKKESEPKSVPVTDLLDGVFMKKHTKFNTLLEFIEAFNKDMSNEEFSAQVDSEEWNNYIKENTSFDGWNNMLMKAGQEYFQKRLGNIFK